MHELAVESWTIMCIRLSLFFCIDQFRRLLQLMCEHWEFFNSERHIMRYYASISQKVTKYFGGTGINNF